MMAATPRRISEQAKTELSSRGHGEEAAKNDDGDLVM